MMAGKWGGLEEKLVPIPWREKKNIMLGILLLVSFLVVGYGFADLYFPEKDVLIRLWLGLVFGLILLMFGMVPFGFLLGFHVVSHILLTVVVWGVYGVCAWKKGRGPSLPRLRESRLLKLLWILCPVFLIIAALMYNHILFPMDGGALASGQSTYGDLSMHLGIITSLAQQQQFPPDYSILPGSLLSYPFLVDSLSSSLMVFGLGLRWAVLLPSFLFVLALVAGVYIVAYTIFGKHSVAILSGVLFFFNGGFGFAYFLEKAKLDPSNFTRIFTAYYQTPTNYNDMNVRWANTICDMIVPQRTTLAGWTVVLVAFYLLYSALTSKRRRDYLVLGCVAGAMPMIHTHSFLALGIVSAVSFFLFLAEEEDKKRYVVNWVIYGAIAIGVALPQLFFWTFSQATGGEFLRFQFNWVNENDPYLWFWIKNVGIVFLLLLPAWMAANKKQQKFYLPFLAVYVVAELVLFQPNEYDNNKLFFIWYMLSAMLVANFMVLVFHRLKGVQGRGVLAAMVLFAAVYSGVLTIGREFRSGGQYTLYTIEDVHAAEYVMEETPADSLFLTGRQHLNPISVLAGRNILVGPDLYLYFHGFREELADRSAILKEVYESDTDVRQLAATYQFDYVYISRYERNDYQINESKFEDLEVVFQEGDTIVYQVS